MEIHPSKLIAQLGGTSSRAIGPSSGLDLPTTLALTWRSHEAPGWGRNAVTLPRGSSRPVRTTEAAELGITRRNDHCLRHPPKEFSIEPG